MNQILIITTEGCEACEIAKDNVSRAMLQSNKKIKVDTLDFHNVPRNIIKENHVKDYPTVLYFVDDKVVTKSVGSFPSAVYLRWIDMYFKT